MRSRRCAHTSTLLLDGRVLIAGGLAYDPPYPYIGTVFKSTEIFDPHAETFEPGPDMLSTRSRHTATLLDDGRVAIAGGPVGVTEIFDPAANAFTKGLDIGPRTGHTATRMPDGRVLFFGGAADAVLGDFRTGAIPTARCSSPAARTSSYGVRAFRAGAACGRKTGPSPASYLRR